jgi:hypothetical protein
MSIDHQCFVVQTADTNILLHVTNVCGECYRDLHEKEMIYYDLQEYRYLCEACATDLRGQRSKMCEIEEEAHNGLF